MDRKFYKRDNQNLCTYICIFDWGGYYLRGNFKISYSIKKIKQFLLNYWIVLFLLMIVSSIIGYRPNIKDMLLEMFGLKLYVMRFCWYVSFYIILMILLPIYVKFLKIKESLLCDISISIVFCVILQVLAKLVEKIDNYTVMSGVAIYLPVAIMGYLLTKYDVLNRIRDKFQKWGNFQIIVGIILICSALVLHGVKGYVKGVSSGIILVPMLVEGIALMQINFERYFEKIFLILGKNSMNIWFFHCAFFSMATRNIFQPIAYIVKIPILVVCWILFLCTIVSIPVEKLQKWVNNKIV